MPLPLVPHGGASDLVERLVSPQRADELVKAAANAPRIVVADPGPALVRRFGDGSLIPHDDFVTHQASDCVLEEIVLKAEGKGFAWGLSLAPPVAEGEAASHRGGAQAPLVGSNRDTIGVLDVADVYDWDKDRQNASLHGPAHSDHHAARMVRDDPRKTCERVSATRWTEAIAFPMAKPGHESGDVVDPLALDVAAFDAGARNVAMRETGPLGPDGSKQRQGPRANACGAVDPEGAACAG